MKGLRAAIVTVACLTVALLAYVYVSFDSNYQVQRAQEAYQKGDTVMAAALLQELEEAGEEVSLYKSYLLRDMENWQGAEEALNQAASRMQQPEVLVGQMLNAWRLPDVERLTQLIERAQEEGYGNQPGVRVFEAALAYHTEDYVLATKQLAGLTFHHVTSAWLRTALQTHLGPNWIQLYQARCQNEIGQTSLAQDALRALAPRVQGQEAIDTQFLLGFIKVREAQQRPLELRAQYYEMALEHFESVPHHRTRFLREQEWVVTSVVDSSLQLLVAERTEDLSALVKLLVHWREEAAVSTVLDAMNARFQDALSEQDWQRASRYARWSRQLDTPEAVAQRIEEQLIMRLERQLDEGRVENLAEQWEVLRALTSDPASLGDRLGAQVEAEVLQRITEDNSQLDATRPYIVFWEIIERDNAERYAFSKRLVTLAGALWVRDDDGQKSLALLKLAEKLPYLTERGAFKAQVEATLRLVYQSALDRDAVEKLGPLFEAVEYFHVDSIQLQDANETANQLEDIRYIYDKRRYAEAWRRLRLMAVVAPDDVRVQRLSGLVAVRLGHYDEGLSYLRHLSKPDNEARAALALAELVVGDRTIAKGLLQELSDHRFFDAEARTKVGFVWLTQGELALAEQWFYMSEGEDALARVGLSFAAYERGAWQEVLQHLSHVAPPYNQMRSLQFVAARALSEAGKKKRAAEAYEQIMAKQNWPNESLLPHYFLAYTNRFLEDSDPQLLAASFYADSGVDDQRALELYLELDDLSQDALLDYAAVLTRLGRADEALQKVATQDFPGVWRARGRAHATRQDWVSAFDAFQQADQQGPLLAADLDLWIEASVKLERWDVVERLLQAHPAPKEQQRQLALEARVRRAGQTELPENAKLLEHLTQLRWAGEAAPKELLGRVQNAEEAAAALPLLLDHGDLARARALAERFGGELTKSSSSALQLARLYVLDGAAERARLQWHRLLSEETEMSLFEVPEEVLEMDAVWRAAKVAELEQRVATTQPAHLTDLLSLYYLQEFAQRDAVQPATLAALRENVETLAAEHAALPQLQRLLSRIHGLDTLEEVR